MELSKANSCRTRDRRPSCDGSVPERSLEWRKSWEWRCESCPIWVGMAPVRLLEKRSKSTSSADSLPIWVGMAPVRLLEKR